MKNIKKYWPYILIILLSVAFYWKVFWQGKMPFPGDLLVGAYFPWLSHKWGYVVGVPVKNPLISDVFSAFFIWKKLAIEAFKSGSWPSWNAYSYAGYPLMANFHSGSLYPLNILMIILGEIKGWNGMIIFQAIGAALSMYWLLKTYERDKVSALLGSVVYAYSSFALSWSQFMTAGQALVWLPLLFVVIEKSKPSGKSRNLLWLSPIFFLIVTAGHFQILVYSALLSVLYFLWQLKEVEDRRKLVMWFLLGALIAIGMSSIQLLPTVDWMGKTVRFQEGKIARHNFGLLPGANLITLLAPDFFGNPVTRNFWGVFNYHETLLYTGVVSVFAWVVNSYHWKKLDRNERFWYVVGALALLMAFDNPLGKLIYGLKVPGLSTSAAGRVISVFTLANGVIVSGMIKRARTSKLKTRIKWIIFGCAPLIISGLIMWKARSIWVGEPELMRGWIMNTNVALRNMILPAGLVMVVGGLLLVVRWHLVPVLLLLITIFDLFRFGWKYVPITDKEFVYPKTKSIEFLQEKAGWWRVESEKGEILPPNTWAAYHLESTSGYDPMAPREYVSYYQRILAKENKYTPSRYSELDSYNAQTLGEAGVKYLMAIKRNEEGEIGGSKLSHKINQEEWEKVFETEDVAILENQKFKPIIRLIDDSGEMIKGSVEVITRKSNELEIEFQSNQAGYIGVRQNYQPGWKAKLNGESRKVEVWDEVFSKIKLGDKQGVLKLEYFPASFQVGLYISILSWLAWGGIAGWGVIAKVKKAFGKLLIS